MGSVPPRVGIEATPTKLHTDELVAGEVTLPPGPGPGSPLAGSRTVLTLAAGGLAGAGVCGGLADTWDLPGNLDLGGSWLAVACPCMIFV